MKVWQRNRIVGPHLHHAPDREPASSPFAASERHALRLNGKSVPPVDDSIVRGTTMSQIAAGGAEPPARPAVQARLRRAPREAP